MAVEVALNGATTKEAHPRVSRCQREITPDALACIGAGAAIVHNHNDAFLRVEDDVQASGPYTEAWQPILAADPDNLVYPTMASGGGAGIAIETR